MAILYRFCNEIKGFYDRFCNKIMAISYGLCNEIGAIFGPGVLGVKPLGEGVAEDGFPAVARGRLPPTFYDGRDLKKKGTFTI